MKRNKVSLQCISASINIKVIHVDYKQISAYI